MYARYCMGANRHPSTGVVVANHAEKPIVNLKAVALYLQP